MSNRSKILLLNALSKPIASTIYLIMIVLNIRIDNENVTKFMMISALVMLLIQIVAKLANKYDLATICEGFVFIIIMYLVYNQGYQGYKSIIAIVFIIVTLLGLVLSIETIRGIRNNGKDEK